VLPPLVRWVVELGKTPVVVKDSPGFVVNRILMPYMNEAVLLVAEGMRTEHVDQAMRRFGMPMGPLELLDQVGLDIAAHAAKSAQSVAGDRFPPNPAFAAMNKVGWLGQKSGKGFYSHEGKQKTVHAAAMIAVQSALGTQGDGLLKKLPPPVQMQQARERMVCLMVNEAALCVGEGLADTAEAIDLAMVFGTGWAPHRGGPLHYADDRGAADIVRVLDDLAKRLGPRFEPCAELRRRSGSAEKFCPIVR
jgi:3-hydroxyacyl-CoA dehydrogenase/enoyl-CoA hydratase/3-hydroxybutyryl-CoA epimerase